MWRVGGPAADARTSIPQLSAAMKGVRNKRHPALTMGCEHLGSHLMGTGNSPQRDWRMGNCQAVLQRFCPSTSRCGAQLPFHIGQPRIDVSALWDMRWGWGALHSTRAAPTPATTAAGGTLNVHAEPDKKRGLYAGCDLTHSRAA